MIVHLLSPALFDLWVTFSLSADCQSDPGLTSWPLPSLPSSSSPVFICKPIGVCWLPHSLRPSPSYRHFMFEPRPTSCPTSAAHKHPWCVRLMPLITEVYTEVSLRIRAHTSSWRARRNTHRVMTAVCFLDGFYFKASGVWLVGRARGSLCGGLFCLRWRMVEGGEGEVRGWRGEGQPAVKYKLLRRRTLPAFLLLFFLFYYIHLV